MYCGKRTLAFLIFFIKSWMQDAGADKMTLDNLQELYKNITPGYQLCYYDGSFCTRGQAFCSEQEKTCKSLFPKDASEEKKLATCKEIIQRNETEPGVYDTCVYFFGKLEILRGFGKHTEDHPHDTHPIRPPGKELCRHPDTFCQLGSEFCNTTSGNCGPLFSPNASDAEKRQLCEQVIGNNMTMLSDACTYALGKMRCSESNVTDNNAVGQAIHNNGWFIAVIVLALCIVIGAITVVVLIIKYKKLLSSKETPTPPAENVPIHAGTTADDCDVPKAAQGLLRKSRTKAKAERD